MNITSLTNENKVFIRTLFHEMRANLTEFMNKRDFTISNPQLFTFLTFAPAALAIASDGVVDAHEIAALEKLSAQINVKTYVSIDLMEMIGVAPEPENVISNEEFNLRVGSEILFLARNMPVYEPALIKAITALLTFDMNPAKEGSMTQSFSALMDSVVANNVSKNKDAELAKMKVIKEKIGV